MSDDLTTFTPDPANDPNFEPDEANEPNIVPDPANAYVPPEDVDDK